MKEIHLTDTAINDLKQFMPVAQDQVNFLDAVETSLSVFSFRRRAPGYGENAHSYVEGGFRVVYDLSGDEIWLRHIVPAKSKAASYT